MSSGGLRGRSTSSWAVSRSTGKKGGRAEGDQPLCSEQAAPSGQGGGTIDALMDLQAPGPCRYWPRADLPRAPLLLCGCFGSLSPGSLIWAEERFLSDIPALRPVARERNDWFRFGNHQRNSFFSQSVFKNYDHDQDGYISQEEFEKIAASFPFSFCVMDKDR